MTGLLAGRRILVVEDRMLVLMHIEAALEDLECTAIHAAGSVAGALDLLGAHKFDAAIIDVNLGGEKSYPVADALVRCGVPCAFATGYGDHGDRHDFKEQPILRKPYIRAALVAVIEGLVRKKHRSEGA